MPIAQGNGLVQESDIVQWLNIVCGQVNSEHRTVDGTAVLKFASNEVLTTTDKPVNDV